MRRLAPILCVVLLHVALLAAAARAQDAAPGAWQPGSTRRQIESAVRDGAADAAILALDRLLDDGTPRVRARHVEAAKAALEFLPRDEAAPRAARLLAEALRIDPSDRDGAWTAAQELRKDLIRRVDVENGRRLLEKLVEVYPNVPQYRHDLANLCLNAGLRDEARAQFASAFRMAPTDTKAAYQLALLAEEDGDTEGAVAIYDQILKARPVELRAHLLKVRILAQDHRPLAYAALDEAERAARASASESVRADWTETFAAERRRMQETDARRDTIRAIEARIGVMIGVAVAAWIAVVAVLAYATRPAR